MARLHLAIPAASALLVLLAAPAPAPSQTPERLAERRPGGIAAIVNQEVITWADLERRMELKKSEDKVIENIPPSVFERERDRLRRIILDALVEQKLLLQDAKKQDVKATDEDVDREIARRIADQFRPDFNINDPEELYRFLKQTFGVSRDEYRNQLRDEIAINRLLWSKYFEPNPFVPRGEIIEFIKTHPERFQAPSEVTFRMISVDNGPDALRILQALDALLDRKPFADVAREYYEEQGRGEEAYLHTMTIEKLRDWKEPLPTEILKLGTGEVKRKIRILTGWRYVEMVSRKPGVKMSFDEAQVIARKEIRRDYQEREKERVLGRLRKEAQVRDFLPPGPGAGSKKGEKGGEKTQEPPEEGKEGKVRDVSPEPGRPKAKG